MPDNLQYTIKKGDNLIKIARKFGLNSLDEILELNPEITNPNLTRINQVIKLPESVEARSSLPAATVVAEAPKWNDKTAWTDLPKSVQQRVLAYRQAVAAGNMNFNDIPRKYQQHVYNQSIRHTTNTAAPYVGKWVLSAPWTAADTFVRGTLNEGRKLVKRVVDGNTSEEDYGVNDYFGNFSWLGKEFQEEHPVADAAINMATTPVVMIGGERLAAGAMDGTLANSLQAAWQNMKNGAQGTVRAMGVGTESVVPTPKEGLPVSNGVKYQTGIKSSGKTGTVTRGARGGFRANISGKGTYSNKSSYAPNGKLMSRATPKDVTAANPFVGTGYWHGLMLPLPEEQRTNYVTVEPEVTHVEETIPTNYWIYNTTPSAVTVPYQKGMETPTYTSAEAPRGRSVSEQPILKESVKTNEGRVIRSAAEKPGAAVGSTPTGVYSGYGFMYGPEGGNLIYRP